MIDPLAITISHPLEREYEAWLVAAIEDDLAKRGARFEIWAVSPDDESSWPADEQILFGGKLIGLQVKRPYLAPGQVGYDRLNWNLRTPAGQFSAVLRYPEIFYCLPAFVNRRLKSLCLHHALFWRPDRSDGAAIWYDNKAGRRAQKHVGLTAPRWGRFLELLISCKIGLPLATPQDVIRRIHRLRDSMRASNLSTVASPVKLQLFLFGMPP